MNDLDRLPDLIPVPEALVHDDVARGERALRRRRLLAGAGSAVAVVVIAGGLAWAGNGHAPRAAPPPYAGPSPSAGTSPTKAPERHKKKPQDPFREYQQQMKAAKPTIGEWRDVLDEHLSKYGTLQEYDGAGFSGSASDFGTKLDWNGGGLLQFMLGPHWNAIRGVPGAPIPKLEQRTYRGMEARVGEANGVLVVSLKHEDGTVVTLLAATSFGNNGSTTASLGLTADHLLEAAADPRLSNPPGQ